MGKSQRQRIAERMQREELANELQMIVRHANRIKYKRLDLKDSYYRWYKVNEETIKALTELKDKMLFANTAANAVAGAASLAEIFGGVLCIAGAMADKRNLMNVGNKISKAGTFVNLGTSEISSMYLQELCETAKRDFMKNKKFSNEFEKLRTSYFQELESFKRRLRTPQAVNSLPLLLETAQRERIDFLGELGLDEEAKSNLRTNLRRMCRSNSKKIKAKTETFTSRDVGSVCFGQIHNLLLQVKQLLEEDEMLSSVFTEETRNFLGENIKSLVPCVATAESYLREYSSREMLQVGASLLTMYSFASESRTGAMINGMCSILSFEELIKRIDNLSNGSKTEESEELAKRIEEMKTMREKIVSEMRKIFGCEEPYSVIPNSDHALQY